MSKLPTVKKETFTPQGAQKMLVKDWMSKEVITVKVTDMLQHAIRVSVEKDVSFIPVLADGKLVGILTDRDIKRASPSDATRMDMKQIMYHPFQG